MAISGSCLCGSVRYEISGPLQAAGNCHCSICRKSHGAAFATWGILEPDTFRWSAGTELLRVYQSSPHNERFFCERCGSPLAAGHSGKVSEVVLATVDGDPGVRPREHIFVGSKACWYEITDSLPQSEEWPPGMSGEG